MIINRISNIDCRSFFKDFNSFKFNLIITSPPYNINKLYTSYKDILPFEDYIKEQENIIKCCYDMLDSNGSLCWQVGNYIKDKSEILPLDIPIYQICNKIGLKLRNRIIWHFEHGLHCKNRFSGRYETILWFTKTDNYVFNLDPVRVPQKYPNKKYFKGPKKGQLSGNPLGKSPGDVWIFPNVKHNHCEKTIHPCSFPIELAERLVLSLTNENDVVFDPFAGVGSALCAAIIHKRRCIGCEISEEYTKIGNQRIKLAEKNELTYRSMNKEIYSV